MNINTNTTRLGGIADLNLESVPVAPATKDETARVGGLSVGMAPTTPLDALDEVDPAVEAALTRDDDLGGLMGRVFNLQPPPMPEFG